MVADWRIAVAWTIVNHHSGEDFMKLIGIINDAVTSLFRKPATIAYPAKNKPVPERYRARLDYNASKCTGCMLCMRDCPTNTIKINVIDRKAKQFVMTYNIGECVYCMQCVFNCRFDALQMTNKCWESASDAKKTFQIYYGKKEHIDFLLANKDQPAADQSEV
jgi:formate hydrogenlyase subunit 6/NADH:ubiquinone oxidoreductase subunit I